jgi:hypothetical protein
MSLPDFRCWLSFRMMGQFEIFSTQCYPDGAPATERSFTVLWLDTMVSRRKRECVRQFVPKMYALSVLRRLRNTFELCMSYFGPIHCRANRKIS